MSSQLSALLRSTAAALALLTVVPAAFADAGHGSSKIGEPGKASRADRTITITIGDSFYEPPSLTVKQGETVRFVLVNQGELLHEFNIGTAAMHAKHQEEMATMVDHGMLTPTEYKDMPGMSHDDPNSVLIGPGQTAELVWEFSTDAKLDFACNVPGHYEAGMVGPIEITK